MYNVLLILYWKYLYTMAPDAERPVKNAPKLKVFRLDFFLKFQLFAWTI